MEQKARIFDGYRKQYLVLFGLLVFSAALFVSAAEEMSSGNIVDDPDQDGLTTEEERVYGTDPSNRDSDGDGYTDGIEISGGYDPLKKAPGDKIISEVAAQASSATVGVENLTEQTAKEIAALVQGATESSEEDQEGADISIEELSAAAQKIASGTGEEVVLPEIDMDAIKIKKQSYKDLSKSKREEKIKEDIIEYLTTVSYLFANNSPRSFKTTEDFENISDVAVSEVTSALSFGDLTQLNAFAENGEKILDQIYEIEVPEKMLDTHIKAIKLAKYAVSLKGELPTNSEEDPLRAINSLSKAQGLLSVSISFASDVQSKLAEYDIDEIPVDF